MSDPAADLDVDDILESIKQLQNPKKQGNQSDADPASAALVLTSALRVDAGLEDAISEPGLTNLRRALGGAEQSGSAPTGKSDAAGEASEFSTIRRANGQDYGIEKAVAAKAARVQPSAPQEDEYYEDEAEPVTSPRLEQKAGGKQPEVAPKKPDAAPNKQAITWSEVDTALIGTDFSALAGLGAASPPPVAPASAESFFETDEAAEPEPQEVVTSDTGAEDEVLDDQPGDVDSADIPVIRFLHRRRAERLGDAPEADGDADDEPVFTLHGGGRDDEDDAMPMGGSNVVKLAGMTVDEDVLREIVVDIVRQELSGKLGEKITRNVRKLVRREIHRALLTRDYD